MSPLGTEALHECRDLKHLLTVLLVCRQHLSFLANHFHASKLVGGNRKTPTNGF